MSLHPFSVRTTAVFGLLACLGWTAVAADHYDLKPQTIELTSSGPLAFGPDGILLRQRSQSRNRLRHRYKVVSLQNKNGLSRVCQSMTCGNRSLTSLENPNPTSLLLI